MTDKIEQKVISMLDALQNGAVEIGGTVVKYAPDLLYTAEKIIQIDAAGRLVPAVIIFILGQWGLRKNVKWFKECDYSEEFLPGFFTIIFAIISIISAICLLNIWHWVAIFEPRLALAKQIAQAALGN